MTVSNFPAGNTIPVTTGQSGKFLSTDGNTLNWSSVSSNSTMFSGTAATSNSTTTFTNLNVKNNIFLMLGNWSAAPGNVTITFNYNSTSYYRMFGSTNGSGSSQNETDLNSISTNISSGNMYSMSPTTFIQISNASSTGPKTLNGWSQDAAGNNLWGGIWDNSNPIVSFSISTSNSVGYSYRMVVQ
jgi:hypothetical protein